MLTSLMFQISFCAPPPAQETCKSTWGEVSGAPQEVPGVEVGMPVGEEVGV